MCIPGERRGRRIVGPMAGQHRHILGVDRGDHRTLGVVEEDRRILVVGPDILGVVVDPGILGVDLDILGVGEEGRRILDIAGERHIHKILGEDHHIHIRKT